MTAFKAARRTLLPLFFAALVLAVPALAGDSGYLGVMLQDLTPPMAKALQLGDQGGVLVSDVVDDSPAEKAGLLDGDVIVAFAGKKLADYESLTAAVRAAKPGEKVDVTVLRDGKQKTFKVELGEREDTFAWRMDGDAIDEHVNVFMKKLHGDDGEFVFRSGAGDRGWLGVHIDDLNGQLGDYFGVKDGAGVLVTEVPADTPAAKAGLKAGDVIVGVGDKDVADTGALQQALAGTKAEQKVKVRYLRQGKKKDADVTLGEMPEGAVSEFRFFGDGGEDFHVRAPRMKYKHLAPKALHRERMQGGPERRIEIIRELGDDDLKELRQELDKMRAELDALRQELKKN